MYNAKGRMDAEFILAMAPEELRDELAKQLAQEEVRKQLAAVPFVADPLPPEVLQKFAIPASRDSGPLPMPLPNALALALEEAVPKRSLSRRERKQRRKEKRERRAVRKEEKRRLRAQRELAAGPVVGAEAAADSDSSS